MSENWCQAFVCMCLCVCTSLCPHRREGKGQSPLEFRGTSYRHLSWILNYQSLSFTDPEHRTAAAPTAEPLGPPCLSASSLAGPKPAGLLWFPHTGPHPFPLGHSPLEGPSLQEAQTWRRPWTTWHQSCWGGEAEAGKGLHHWLWKPTSWAFYLKMAHSASPSPLIGSSAVCLEHSILPTGGKFLFTAVTRYIFKTAVALFLNYRMVHRKIPVQRGLFLPEVAKSGWRKQERSRLPFLCLVSKYIQDIGTSLNHYVSCASHEEGTLAGRSTRVTMCVHVCSVSQSCPTLRDPMDCSPPGSSVHGIF